MASSAYASSISFSNCSSNTTVIAFLSSVTECSILPVELVEQEADQGECAEHKHHDDARLCEWAVWARHVAVGATVAGPATAPLRALPQTSRLRCTAGCTKSCRAAAHGTCPCRRRRRVDPARRSCCWLRCGGTARADHRTRHHTGTDEWASRRSYT